MNATMSRKATRRADRRRRLFRSLVSSTLALLATTGIALATTGGTYAIWNKAAAPAAATLTAGTAALTVSQPAALTNLAPGRTVGQPFTVTNTGDTPLTVSISASSFSGNLASSANVQITASPTCDPSAAAVWSRSSAGTTTAATTAIATVAVGQSVTLCYSVAISTSAASNTEGGSLTSSLTVSGKQS